MSGSVHLAPAPPELTAGCEQPRLLPDGPLTQAEAERHWARDRAALAGCRERQAALADFYAQRDARLAGRP